VENFFVGFGKFVVYTWRYGTNNTTTGSITNTNAGFASA